MQYKPGQCKPLHYPRPNSCTRGKSDEFQPVVLLALTPFSPLFTVSERLVTSAITLKWLPEGARDLSWPEHGDGKSWCPPAWWLMLPLSESLNLVRRFVLLARKKFILHYFYDRVTAFDLQSTKRWNVK